jgi:hypothetical protein
MARIGFARLRGVTVGLVAMSGGQVRVTDGRGGILRLEIPFRFR